MPPFCLFWIVKSLMCSEREGSRYVTDIENHIWKWYERKRLKSLVCSLVKRVCLATNTESDWLDACNTEFNWMVLGSSTQQTLFRCSPPVNLRLLLTRHRLPLSGHCPRHGAVRCWKRARSRAWNADRQTAPMQDTQTQDTQTQDTQMRQAMGKTSLGCPEVTGKCWTFCSHGLRLYITLPLSTFLF